MRKRKLNFLVMLFTISLLITGCGPGQIFGPTPTLTPTPTPTPVPYALICDMDKTVTVWPEAYWIQGEEGEYDDDADYKLVQYYDDQGNIFRAEWNITHDRLYSESGNTYSFVTEIVQDFENDSLSYEITVTGGVFTEPQTCSN